MTLQLTEEQKQIIEHPDGRHALVLAVAGSGKTTTMAHRIKHLAERGVLPHEIRVLMFNAQAREEFQSKLEELDMEKSYGDQVRTFHSAGLAAVRRFIRSHRQWYGDSEELKHLNIKRAVDWIMEKRQLEDDIIDVAEAERAIDLWKGSLIPPSRAGYSGTHGGAYVAVYKRFEEERRKANALTYDDFTYLACLNADRNFSGSGQQSNGTLREQLSDGVRYIIVDEYQDVNLGQQRFVEILASRGADVMVVGDDDQTIYEWRGARSEYIRREFQSTLTNKPHSQYKLTNSFRFGFLIAQTSYNVVSHNTDRQPKDVLTYTPAAESELHVFTDDKEAGESSNRALADEIQLLVAEQNVKPEDIWVLGRTYAQMNGLQSEMIVHKIPFIVQGERNFMTSPEADGLLGYVRVAAVWDQPVTGDLKRDFMTIANRPNRSLARRDMENMLDAGIKGKVTLANLLGTTLDEARWFVNERAQERLNEFFELLEAVAKRLGSTEGNKAGPFLSWLNEAVGYTDHYLDYYGEGERSENRIRNINALIEYANRMDIDWHAFLEHVRAFDSTLGYPDDKVIHMTSIHQVKGREFDYVIIPDCLERFMPVFGSNNDPTFDVQQGANRSPKPAEWIENERRLFYVAATRAKKALYIGTKGLQFAPAPRSKRGTPVRDSADSDALISSRFLEEMEIDPTRDVATEVVKAARGEDNRLVEILEQATDSGLRKIVGGVEAIAGSLGPIGDRVAGLFRRKARPAERPFTYQQAYDSPKRDMKQPETESKVWPHMDLNRSRRSRRSRPS